jgi:hypothetical protein
MSTETLEAPEAEDNSLTDFSASLDSILAAIPDDSTPAAEPTPAVEPEPKPDDAPPPDKVEEKPVKGFRALKEAKEREKEEAVAAVRAEYETRLAELTGRAGEVDTVKATYEEKLAAAEALKSAHEARLTELESKIVGEWEIPYSIDVDPEAAPVLGVIHNARTALDTAVDMAASSLAEDQRSVEVIAANKRLFGDVLGAMAQGLVPDVVHAQSLVAGLAKIGVTVGLEEARQAVRDLKPMVGHLRQVHQANQQLANIKAKNEPNWTQQQAARHEAYRREIAGAADVPDEASERDEAIIAGILKGRPELREKLRAESDRLAAIVIGPVPGKATATAIRATPTQLHRTAVTAARLPVVMEAYRERMAELTAAQARIAELEARIGGSNNAVPRPGAATTPPATKVKVDFNAALAEVLK